MSVNVGSAVAYLELDASKFQLGLKNAVSSLQQVNNSTGTTTDKFKNLGNGIKGVGATLSLASVPLLAFGASSIKTASDFQAGMDKVQALSGATSEDMKKLEAKAREMGSTTKFSATQAAEGLSYMALAGWSTEQMSKGLEPALKLAGAAGMDLGLTCDIVTDTMSMFGMKADEAAKMTDILAYAQANSNTSVEQLGEALKYCGAGANAMGYDLADTASILGKFADQGLKGSSAGTTLNAMFRDMKAKAKDGAIAIGENKVAIVDAKGNYRDFNDILHDVEQATNGMTTAQKDQALSAIWGTEALKGVNMALEAGSDSIKKFEEGIRSSDGTASQMYDTMQNNLKGSIDNLKSAFEGVCITIGNLLIPIIQRLVDGLTNALTWFNNLSPGIQSVIVAVGGFIAILGPLLIIIGQTIIFVAKVGTALSTVKSFFVAGGAAAKLFGGAISFLTGPFGIAIAAIAALIAVGVLLYKNWDTIKQYASVVWEAVKNTIIQTWEGIKNKASEIWDGIKTTVLNTWNGIKEISSSVWNGIKNVVSTVWEGIKSVTSPAVNFIKSIVSIAWNSIKTISSSIWQSISTIIKSVWELIKAIIKLNITLIQALIKVGWNAIKSVTTTVWNAIKSVIQKVWSAIKPIVTAGVNAIKSVVTTGFNAVKNVVTTIWNAIKSVTSSVWNSIKSVVSSAVNGVKSVISSVFNSIKSVVTTAWNGVKSATSSAWSAIKSAVSAGANAVKSTVSAVFSGITAIITAPFKAAASVISGILGGITSSINRVTSAVQKVTGLAKGKSIEAPGNGEELLNEDDYSMARFNYNAARETYYSGVIAESYSMLDTIKDFKNNLKTTKDSSKVNTSNNFNISLNIDKMMNTDNRSIEDIADELAFYIKRKSFI